MGLASPRCDLPVSQLLCPILSVKLFHEGVIESKSVTERTKYPSAGRRRSDFKQPYAFACSAHRKRLAIIWIEIRVSVLETLLTGLTDFLKVHEGHSSLYWF